MIESSDTQELHDLPEPTDAGDIPPAATSETIADAPAATAADLPEPAATASEAELLLRQLELAPCIFSNSGREVRLSYGGARAYVGTDVRQVLAAAAIEAPR